MADWKQEYIEGILNAEQQHNVNREFIVACESPRCPPLLETT
jgi:hypothetical protein